MRLLLALALCLLVQPTMQHTGQIIWQPRVYEPAASTQASKSLAPQSFVQAAPQVYGPAVEVSPSVYTFNLNDFDEGVCEEQVQRAALLAARSIQIVTTSYWAPWKRMVDRYCLVQWINGTGECVSWNATLIARQKKAVYNCIISAARAGFTRAITLNPRLDCYGSYGCKWRAELNFDPLMVHGTKAANTTYYHSTLLPLAQAATDARKLYPKTVFKLVLGGEMQYTLSYYPSSYLTVVSQLKKAAPGLLLGAHFTNYLLCEDCAKLLANKTEARAYQTLFNKSLDFMGVSAYPSVDPVYETEELGTPIDQIAYKLKLLKVDVDAIAKRGGGIVVSEYGWGGSADDNGITPASSVREVSKNSWKGIFGNYDKAKDPFRQYNEDWFSYEIRDWLRSTYTKTTSWLKNGGGPWKVPELFLWNLASWDVVGVHHSSYDSTWTVGYQDRVISQMLANYNGKLNNINVDQHRFEQPFAKWGNKGNTSCDEYCRAPIEQRFGACARAVDTASGRVLGCDAVRGPGKKDVVCHCISPRFSKAGNNGAVSCSAFCKNKQYGGVAYHGCSSAYDRAAMRDFPCNDVRGAGKAEVTCYCGGTGVLKVGNNGIVSCSTYCLGDWAGQRYVNCTKAYDQESMKEIGCDARRGVGVQGAVSCFCNGPPTVKVNNGTGNCKNLCTAQNFKNNSTRFGSCLAAIDQASGKDVGCTTARKAGAANQACHCADPLVFKEGNNGAVSCDAYCAGKGWGNIAYSSCGATYDLLSKKDISCRTSRGYDKSKPGVMCYCRV